MIALVIGINCTVALLSFYLAWRLWHWGKALATLADALTTWEESAHTALNPDCSPALLRQGQQQVAQRRQQYAYLQGLLRQGQRSLAVLGMVLSLSRWLGLTGQRRTHTFQKRQTQAVKQRASRERR